MIEFTLQFIVKINDSFVARNLIVISPDSNFAEPEQFANSREESECYLEEPVNKIKNLCKSHQTEWQVLSNYKLQDQIDQ